MAIDVVLFDLDNTLYAAEHALFELIDVRINRYMRDVVGIAAEQVDELRQRYWREYGVTLQGLMREHGADAEDYLEYVHDIDVASRLQHNPRLRAMLRQLPQRKFVFTNGSSDHADRVLNCLGVADCFDAIFDIRVSNYVPKPHPQPYHAVLRATGVEAGRCVMVEDSPANLCTAAELGMKTVLVSDGCCGTWTQVARVEQVGDVIQQWM